MGCRGVSSLLGNAFERESNERQHIIIKWQSANVVSSLGIQRRALGRVGSSEESSRGR